MLRQGLAVRSSSEVRAQNYVMNYALTRKAKSTVASQVASDAMIRRKIEGHEDAVLCCHAIPGNLLVSGGEVGTVVISVPTVGPKLLTVQLGGQRSERASDNPCM